uniref:Uncharacterized protein n=1 Tax=Arundo donax TaxID=35708 RepID=A0A0A9EVW1_ARUDO
MSRLASQTLAEAGGGAACSA